MAVIFLIVLVWGLIRRISTTYTITNRRLTIRTGLLSREMHETRLERVQNVNSRQRLLERLLRVGTVDFDTAGGASYDFKFRGVDDPHQIVRTVDKALHELRLTHPQVWPEPPRVYARTAAGSSPAATRSAAALSVRSHVKS